MKSYDVIVVGVGAMGSAVCHQLAERGVRVLGLDQFDIGHKLGSSGGQTRLIRLAYYEHPDYVPLLRRAYELWDALERVSGEKLFYRAGGLYIGHPDAGLISGSLASARQHSLVHELLSRDGLKERYPQFRVPDDYVALFEADAGLLLSERIIAVQARLAVRHGADIRDNERVRGWSASDGGVTVQTDRGEYHGGQLIFTAGAWTDKLLRGLGVPLSVTRQVLGWVAPRRPAPFRLGACPCFAIQHGDGLFYGFPMLDGDDELKIAHHHRGPAADPDTLDRHPTAQDEADFRPGLREYLPDADGSLRRMHICMYTYSPDGHFILDRHPAEERVLLACGFSGHGFKFAAVIGEALADLAMQRRTELPVEFLRLSRLATLK